jgi:Lrp/AsnC family transcriptional regulator, regulator for asnA, asnC and gidA
VRGVHLHGLRSAQLDELDRRLISLLQEDGRRTVSEMARAVGHSHAAVRQRINRLLEDDVVSIAAVTHPGTHGYGTSATVAVRTDHRVAEVSEGISEIPEVYYVVTVIGEWDVIVELMARDPQHLQSLVMTIRELPGVLSTSTFSFVETVKWVYSPAFID